MARTLQPTLQGPGLGEALLGRSCPAEIEHPCLGGHILGGVQGLCRRDAHQAQLGSAQSLSRCLLCPFPGYTMRAEPCPQSSTESKSSLHRVRSFWAPSEAREWGLCVVGPGSVPSAPRGREQGHSPLSSLLPQIVKPSPLPKLLKQQKHEVHRLHALIRLDRWVPVAKEPPSLQPAPAGDMPSAPSPHGSPRAARGGRGAEPPVPRLCSVGRGTTNGLFCLAFDVGYGTSCVKLQKHQPAAGKRQRRWRWRNRGRRRWRWRRRRTGSKKWRSTLQQQHRHVLPIPCPQ